MPDRGKKATNKGTEDKNCVEEEENRGLRRQKKELTSL